MKETRVANLNVETRAEGDDAQSLVLVGMPIVFDTPTVIHDPFIGDYNEVIKRTALDETVLDDTRLLYNHDSNKIPLARTPKTMSLNVAEKGVEMRAVLANTATSQEVYTAVERGDLSGMSFAFKVPKGGDSYDRATNTRTISKIEKVYEVSVVPFPAYPQTSVEARSSIQLVNSKAYEKARITLNQILKH